MRAGELRRSIPTPKAKGQVRAGLRYAHSNPELWIPLVMMAIVGTLTFNFSVTYPLFVKKTLGGSDTTFTILYSVVSIGSLAGALLTARRRTVEVRDVVVGSTLFGVAMLLFSLAPGLIAAFPLAILVGFTSIIFMTTSTAIVQLRSDPAMRGRVLALQAIVFLGSTPIGGPVLGWVCDQFGARAGFIVGGVAALGAAAWGTFAGNRRTDQAVVPIPVATESLTHS